MTSIYVFPYVDLKVRVFAKDLSSYLQVFVSEYVKKSYFKYAYLIAKSTKKLHLYVKKKSLKFRHREMPRLDLIIETFTLWFQPYLMPSTLEQ